MARKFESKREPRTALQKLFHKFHAHRVVAVSALNSLCILFISWLLVVALGMGNTPFAQAEKPRPEVRPPVPVNRVSASNVQRVPRPTRTFGRRSSQPPTTSRKVPWMGRQNYPAKLREQPKAGR